MKFCGVEFALFLISPFCFQERSSLLKRLGTLKDPEVIRTVAEGNDLEEPVNITGLETFSLSYKVCSTGIFFFKLLFLFSFVFKVCSICQKRP